MGGRVEVAGSARPTTTSCRPENLHHDHSMQIRPVQPADLDLLTEIDGTIESTQYVHVDRSGEGLALAWRLEERPLRERLVKSNPIDDDRRFVTRQIVTGADEGIAIMAEHDGVPV